MPPRFSVVIANHNYAALVGDAIRSALDQQGPPGQLEVIVVDDGSTDGSPEVLAQLAASEPRLRVLLQDNRGQAAAFDAAVQAARGELICFLDSDDLFHPAKLQRVAQCIEARGLAGDDLLLCHDLDILDSAGGRTLAEGWFATMGIDRLGDTLDPAHNTHAFPFSIPAGLVIGRPLAAACLQAMPSWDFRRGVDSPLCMAAMLKAWRVHYLHEVLATYRVHGANESARVVDGRYRVGIRLDERIPRLLAFLERWVDQLDLPHGERQLRLSALRWLEHFNRVASPSRRLVQPAVDVVLLPGGSAAAREASATAAQQQSHGAVALHEAAAGASDFATLAAAWRATRGAYVQFLRPGDRPDREGIERHLHWRQHGALVGVSCSDVRLCDADGALIHADVFARSGAWKQPLQQVPPLATRLADWVAPPLAGCLFRRDALLDALFDEPDLPPALRAAAPWLLFQLQHHTAGVLRIRESLVNVALPAGAVAGYGYLSAPADLSGALQAPPLQEASAWLAGFARRHGALLGRWLPPAWHQRFGAWVQG